MNIVLWIIAGVLAAIFALAGLTKATKSKEQLAPKMPYVEDVSAGTLKLVGVLEVLGAVGLILPAATGVAVVLTPLAAAGLAAIMLPAIAIHARRKEHQSIVVNLVLLALAAFVAIMRFGPYAF